MTKILVKLNPTMRELVIIYVTSVIITIFSCLFFTIRGYPLVTTATETLSIYTPPLYMISIFFPFGILLGEVIWLWNEEKELYSYILLLIECLIIGIFSFIRYIVSIPFSGHMIILSFYLLHQIINKRIQYPSRLFFGIAVFIVTMIYKIFFWNDPLTLILGALLGTVLWLPGFLYRQKRIKNKCTIFHI